MANYLKQNEAPISQMSAEALIAKRKALLEKANGNESPITSSSSAPPPPAPQPFGNWK